MFKLFRFLKPYKFYVLAIFALVFLTTIADLYLPTLNADIIDKGIMAGDKDFIWKTGGVMLLITFGGMMCSILASFLTSQTAVGFGRIIREKVFSKVESFSLHEFDKIGTSTLITRTTNDITQVQMVTMIILRMMIGAPLMAIGGIILALSKDKTLTLVLAVVLPILAGIIALIALKGMPLFKLMQVKIDKVNLVLRETLTGIRVIRAFNQSDKEAVRFEAANEDLTDNSIKVNRIMAFLMPVLMLMMNLTTIAIIWFGGIRIDNGSMDLGALVAFMQYAMQILFSVVMVSMMFVMVPRAAASAVRINEVLDTVPEITDPVHVKKAGSDAETDNDAEVESVTVEGTLRGFVEFKDVSFSYPGAEQPAILGISFNAKPGEVIAIIGGTGSGKSTLINLIPRFYDVNNGSVLVDGVDVREMTQEELRAKIGFVPQKTVLFSGTISDNIRYGKDNASDEEIQRAAETAQATEFINTMEDGYDSTIEQGGTNVSGGQKQRLSIARALVRKPEIYIFDDSFSALDFKTDAKLRAALKKETADSTVIIISQRVSTVMDADRIIVLNDGIIVGMGKHKELMNTCEIYHEIVASQLSEEEIA